MRESVSFAKLSFTDEEPHVIRPDQIHGVRIKKRAHQDEPYDHREGEAGGRIVRKRGRA